MAVSLAKPGPIGKAEVPVHHVIETWAHLISHCVGNALADGQFPLVIHHNMCLNTKYKAIRYLM